MNQEIIRPDAEELTTLMTLRDDFIDAGMRLREHTKPHSTATQEQVEQAEQTYNHFLQRMTIRVSAYLPWLLQEKGLDEVQAAVNDSRKQTYLDTRTAINEIYEMLAPVPYRIGCEIAARLSNIDDTLIDNIGAFVGECQQCGEGIFENDGHTNLSEDGDMPCHDLCYPKWVEENADAIKQASDDEDE